MSKYLAIDIGASSGRAIITDFDNKIELKEVNRFTIEVNTVFEKKRLNLKKLEQDVKASIKKALAVEPNITSIGIDTWAVDFVCLDQDYQVVDDPMFYRDQTFVESLREYQQHFCMYELYQKTGIQIQPFNTFFQLNKLEENYQDKNIKHILLLPDYLNYMLSGVLNTEFTNATTTQCFGHRSFMNFHEQNHLFKAQQESRRLGFVNPNYTNGVALELISVASHDTASAHVAIAGITKETAFISSGTWSLLGIDVEEPITTRDSFVANFSNEGSYNQKYRFQKNIMGLWMIVNLAKENNITDFAKLASDASQAKCDTIIDVNDYSFLSPEKMQTAIKNYCLKNNLDVPKTIAEYARVVYRSLAVCYLKTIREIESITGRNIKQIIIVGGGANVDFLNQELKVISQKEIVVFAYECSALGNALVQAIETKAFANILKAHEFVRENLDFKLL